MDANSIVLHKISDLEGISAFDVEMALDEAQTAVKNYCHIHIIPIQLRYVVANIASDILHYRFPKNSVDVGDIAVDDVASISVDDVSVNLKSESNRKHTIDLDSFVLNYASQLANFRQFIWR